jgi:hypothetical protein
MISPTITMRFCTNISIIAEQKATHPPGFAARRSDNSGPSLYDSLWRRDCAVGVGGQQ